jgi:hypothetical protein
LGAKSSNRDRLVQRLGKLAKDQEGQSSTIGAE